MSANRLWERQEWDDDLTFGVFSRWLLMTPRRDIVEAWRQHSETDSRVPLAIRDAYDGTGNKPSWEERARAYDVDHEERGMLFWAAQRNVIRQVEYELAMKMMEKAKEMLDWPLHQDTLHEDGKTIIREPAKWSIRDVQMMVATASKVARLAAEMEQSIQKMVFVLSPEAIDAIKRLETFGVQYADVITQFERQIIEMPERYERLQSGHTE